MIKEIQVITNLGPRCFVKGREYDYAEIVKVGIDTARYVLYKNGMMVTTIHESVPVIVDYDAEVRG